MRHHLNEEWLTTIRTLTDEEYYLRYGHKRHAGILKGNHRRNASIPLPDNWDELRKAIIERDIICQECGNKEWLGVHHKDLNRLNNSLDNLILLSWTCHMKKHHKGKSP